MSAETIPAVFTFRRGNKCWLVYHDERGYIGRLALKSAGGARRLLRESREEAHAEREARTPIVDRIYRYESSSDSERSR